jgi:hypothetical protein
VLSVFFTDQESRGLAMRGADLLRGRLLEERPPKSTLWKFDML